MTVEREQETLPGAEEAAGQRSVAGDQLREDQHGREGGEIEEGWLDWYLSFPLVEPEEEESRREACRHSTSESAHGCGAAVASQRAEEGAVRGGGDLD
eukprot:54710-Hanusia_phi.AAC.1